MRYWNWILFLFTMMPACRGEASFDKNTEAPVVEEAMEQERDGSQPGNPLKKDSKKDEEIPTVRMIIKTGALSIVVDKHDSANAGLQQMAVRLGGYVTSTSTDLAYAGLKRTTMTIRVPAQHFDEAMGACRTFSAKIESESVEGTDVTEEFVDTEARLSNKKAEEKQLLTILQRTGSVTELLEVQRELFRVREEIERHEGRRKFLLAQVSMATITVTFHEDFPIEVSGRGGFWATVGSGFETGFVGFANVLAGVIAFLIGGIPVFILIFLITWLILRHFRKQKAAKAAA